MDICFVDGTSIINRVHRIDLGKLTCEQLNTRSWKEFGILRAHLDFFIPFEDITVAEFLEQNERASKSVEEMKAMLSSNRYYQLNDEAANTFAAVEALLEDRISESSWDKYSFLWMMLFALFALHPHPRISRKFTREWAAVA